MLQVSFAFEDRQHCSSHDPMMERLCECLLEELLPLLPGEGQNFLRILVKLHDLGRAGKKQKESPAADICENCKRNSSKDLRKRSPVRSHKRHQSLQLSKAQGHQFEHGERWSASQMYWLTRPFSRNHLQCSGRCKQEQSGKAEIRGSG